MEINIGEFSEALNDKMDTDLNNRTNTSGFRKLKSSYYNGNNWYKIFEEIQSDGSVKEWCEQGGISLITGGYGATTLLQMYENTNYTIVAIEYFGTNVQSSFNNADIVAIDSVTISSFRILGSTNVDGPLDNVLASWYTCGYIN